MSIDNNAAYHAEINLNNIARFLSAVETVKCDQCCFYPPSLTAGSNIGYPVFNGTNGTDVFTATALGM
jgi:hypothetical protein